MVWDRERKGERYGLGMAGKKRKKKTGDSNARQEWVENWKRGKERRRRRRWKKRESPESEGEIKKNIFIKVIIVNTHSHVVSFQKF